MRPRISGRRLGSGAEGVSTSGPDGADEITGAEGVSTSGPGAAEEIAGAEGVSTSGSGGADETAGAGGVSTSGPGAAEEIAGAEGVSTSGSGGADETAGAGGVSTSGPGAAEEIAGAEGVSTSGPGAAEEIAGAEGVSTSGPGALQRPRSRLLATYNAALLSTHLDDADDPLDQSHHDNHDARNQQQCANSSHRTPDPACRLCGYWVALYGGANECEREPNYGDETSALEQTAPRTSWRVRRRGPKRINL